MSKTTVKVDGMEWNVAAVAAYATEADFVAAFVAESHIYPFKHPHEREASLKTVYSVCVPAKAEPAKKASKAEKPVE
jgi:hypothetical protein